MAVRVDGGAGSRGVAVVQVAGEVRRPGVYRVRAGQRVNDAVRMAGGATPRADLAGVNLAAKVEDGRQVIVPARVTAAGAAPRPRAAGWPPAGRGSVGGRRRPAQPQHRHRGAAGRARRRRPGHRPQDRRLPPAARRLSLGVGAGPGARHRAQAAGRAQGPAVGVIVASPGVIARPASRHALAVRSSPPEPRWPTTRGTCCSARGGRAAGQQPAGGGLRAGRARRGAAPRPALAPWLTVAVLAGARWPTPASTRSTAALWARCSGARCRCASRWTSAPARASGGARALATHRRRARPRRSDRPARRALGAPARLRSRPRSWW